MRFVHLPQTGQSFVDATVLAKGQANRCQMNSQLRELVRGKPSFGRLHRWKSEHLSEIYSRAAGNSKGQLGLTPIRAFQVSYQKSAGI